MFGPLANEYFSFEEAAALFRHALFSPIGPVMDALKIAYKHTIDTTIPIPYLIGHTPSGATTSSRPIPIDPQNHDFLLLLNAFHSFFRFSGAAAERLNITLPLENQKILEGWKHDVVQQKKDYADLILKLSPTSRSDLGEGTIKKAADPIEYDRIGAKYKTMQAHYKEAFRAIEVFYITYNNQVLEIQNENDLLFRVLLLIEASHPTRDVALAHPQCVEALQMPLIGAQLTIVEEALIPLQNALLTALHKQGLALPTGHRTLMPLGNQDPLYDLMNAENSRIEFVQFLDQLRPYRSPYPSQQIVEKIITLGEKLLAVCGYNSDGIPLQPL
jgi:hypothetical protein